MTPRQSNDRGRGRVRGGSTGRASGRGREDASRRAGAARRERAASDARRGGTGERAGSPNGSRAGSRSTSRGGASRSTDALHSNLANVPISRQAFVMGLLGIAGLAGVSRLAEYQLINADRYQSEANARRLSSQVLYAKRGTIYDRGGNVLVSSAECKNVYVNPQLISKKKRRAAIAALVEVLGVDEDAAADAVDADTTFVYVKRQVDLEDAELLAAKKIAGIEFEPAIKRVYPYGTLASQVLGIVNIDNVGISGLEKQYDEVLTGTNGSLVRERALDGSFIAGGAYKKEPAQDGMDIMLGLDVNIQRAAEDALALAVENSGAKYGSVIVTEPATGEILAACSCPTYDPTDLSSARNADLNLRVVTDAYEPGSVFKTFVTAAGIDLNIISPTTTFNVPASVQVGDDTVRDVDERAVPMTMDVREILRRSSNTGMVLVGERLGADNFDTHVIGSFGFGERTGIDFPGEAIGLVKERDEYDGASLGAMSFGQALAVPPVQMVRAMSAIANKGVMTTPHFLKTRAGEEVDWTDGETRACGEEAASAVADMMRTVVNEGTGEGARMEGYDISGKTGTAERAGENGGYEEGNNMASFMGFATTKDPRVLCYVTLDGTPAMSYAATPVFKAVMETALPALGIEPGA